MKEIVVYADESGTHDKTGKQTGSQHPVVAGIAASPTEWLSFSAEWQAVLNKYKVPYFHSRELRAVKSAIENNKPATPELKKKSILWLGVGTHKKILNDIGTNRRKRKKSHNSRNRNNPSILQNTGRVGNK